MVKLPDFTALGVNNPRPASSSPSFPGSDPRAAALGGLGQTIAGLGMREIKEQREIDDTLDLAKAQAGLHSGLLQIGNQFENDPNYDTYGQRSAAATRGLADSLAQGIRSPRMRALWRARADESLASANDSIIDQGTKLKREDDGVNLRSSLDKLHAIVVDPLVTDEKVKAKARQDMADAITAAHQSGLLVDPTEVEKYNKAYVEGSDKVRANLAVRNGETFGGKNVTVEGVPPEGAAFLNVIKGGESSGAYNVINGGATFSDYSHHPKEGLHGDHGITAGAYQFLPSTWARVLKANPDIKDFSPASQDKGAWWLAQDDYRRKSGGRDLVTDLKSKDANVLAGVRRTLSSTWEALRPMGDGNFANAVANGKTTFDRDFNDFSNAPDYVKRLSPEDRQDLSDLIDREQSKQGVDLKTGIEIATQNGPAAITNTGTYSGHVPSASEFAAAYGAGEGAQRYAAFQSSMNVATQVHGFQTASESDIAQAVQAATPTQTGDGAAVETRAYNDISTAAKQTIEAREKDPVSYVRQAFPNVDKAWADGAQNGDFQPAIAATMSAKSQLGIQNADIIPTSVATNVVGDMKDETKTPVDRFSPTLGLLQGTSDPVQRKAMIDQLVKAGMPEMTMGAISAWERGDTGAAQRLFAASTTDISKLPGVAPFKPKDIQEQMGTDVYGQDQVGDVANGLTGNEAGDYKQLERDSQLMLNAITIGTRHGLTLEQATAQANKDIYGDVKAVVEQGVKIIVKADEDPQARIDHLNGLRPQVRAALDRRFTLPKVDPTKGGIPEDALRIDASIATDDIMENGYMWEHNGGYMFINPYSGKPVPGDDGKPLFFTEKDFLNPTQGPPVPASTVPEASSSMVAPGMDAILGRQTQ